MCLGLTCCGLWSNESGIAWPFLSHRTPLESPTLATNKWAPCTMATSAVEPNEWDMIGFKAQCRLFIFQRSCLTYCSETIRKKILPAKGGVCKKLKLPKAFSWFHSLNDFKGSFCYALQERWCGQKVIDCKMQDLYLQQICAQSCGYFNAIQMLIHHNRNLKNNSLYGLKENTWALTSECLPVF